MTNDIIKRAYPFISSFSSGVGIYWFTTQVPPIPHNWGIVFGMASGLIILWANEENE